ncbi:MAG: hypothetical protein ACI9LO_002120 [Planctomycetota bacterium]|jgi:hypothetical protein
MNTTRKFSNPRETITELVEACHSGDVDKLRGVFSQGSLMSGYYKGEFYSGSPEPFFDELRDNPSPASTGAEYIGEIISVEEFGDIASIILNEKGYLGANFINLFQLICIDANWLIVSKTYVDEW